MEAIDNNSYRQLNTVDALKATQDLRDLKRKNILDQKGKGKATYYIAGGDFLQVEKQIVNSVNIPPPSFSVPPQVLCTLPSSLSTPLDIIAEDIKQKIAGLGQRVNDTSVLKEIIKEVCQNNYFKSTELASILSKDDHYIKRKFLTPMISEGTLEYLYPEMLNHLQQAYRTKI